MSMKLNALLMVMGTCLNPTSIRFTELIDQVMKGKGESYTIGLDVEVKNDKAQ